MEENSHFSIKMKKLRIEKKISLETLAEETGYSVEYLTQIENNEVMAPVSVILSVSQALAVASEEFLLSKEEASSRRKVLKQRKERFEKRSENYSYEVLTPEGKNKHLNAFKVTIEANQDFKMVDYHHPGEEIIYVLSGILELNVARTTHTLEANDCIHFDSSKSHKLRSLSDEPTTFLVTIYSP